MSNIYTIIRKELAGYFNSPVAYIFMGVFLVLSSWIFFQKFFLISQATMRWYFDFLPWVFLLLIPAVTMRSFAEEKKNGTLELLLTLPVRDWEVVLGKFLSGLIFIIITVLFSLSIPFTINYLGDLDFGPVLGGYLGAFFLAGAYLSLALFISSLSRNQVVAFIVATASIFFLFILGTSFVLNSLPFFLIPLVKFLSPWPHFSNIGRGVLDTRDLIYYLSFIFFFLWLSVQSLESRNWK